MNADEVKAKAEQEIRDEKEKEVLGRVKSKLRDIENAEKQLTYRKDELVEILGELN